MNKANIHKKNFWWLFTNNVPFNCVRWKNFLPNQKPMRALRFDSKYKEYESTFHLFI